MRFRSSWLLLGCFQALGVAACKDDACTEIGCTNGLIIELKTPIGTDQTVHVRIEMGDDVRDCEVSPDEDTCDAVDVTVQRDGDAYTELDVVDASVGDVKITLTPSDGDATAAELSPEWEDGSNNGDGCKPSCQFAVVEI